MAKLPKEVIDITGKTKAHKLRPDDARRIGRALEAGELSQTALAELVELAPGLVGLQVKSITQAFERAAQGQSNQAEVLSQLRDSSERALATLEVTAAQAESDEVRVKVVEAIAQLQGQQLQVLEQVNQHNNLTMREVVRALVGVAAMAGGIKMATSFWLRAKA